ncbi:hypothetical protein [Streptomyces sp. NPDC005438]|uniref:hypothetical protein n=1 Tax=Streptomyces sp. NPDC005438 TaxID=3156880 RepID=UPI0033ABB05F
MPIANDIRKSLSDPTPLYFAAGVIDKIREEAPGRIAAVRATDTKELQDKFNQQAKATQARVSGVLDDLDADLKKLREQAQTLALQSVGVAAEYAVKAREAYDDLAQRGRGAVRTWRGEEEAPSVTVEREPVTVVEPRVAQEPTGAGTKSGSATASGATKPANGTKAGSTTGSSGGATTRKATAKKATGTRKTTPKSTGTTNKAGATDKATTAKATKKTGGQNTSS